MPVVIVDKRRYVGTITPSGLNIEEIVVDIKQQQDEYMVEGYMDLGELDTGDTVEITEYIAVDGATLRKFRSSSFSGPLKEPIIRVHTKTLDRSFLYRLTITQKSGTIRSFPYGFLLEILGVT